MEWGAAVAAFFTVLLAVLKWWQSQQPKRDQEQSYDDIQQGRADISAGNADAVNGRIDRLLTRQPLSTGQQGDTVTVGRIGAILGLAAATRSIGADTGTSGSVPETKTVTSVILDSAQKVK